MMSKGYKTASDGKEQPYEYINLAPAGSLASTGADMGNFMIAHLQNGAFGGKRILREETAREMHGTGQDLGRSAQQDDARLLRNHRQRPPRDRAWRRHAVVPQRPAAVPGRRHRHLRLDQQLRQGRQRTPDPRRPGHRLRQPLPARAREREDEGRRRRDREAARAADRRHRTTAAAAPIRTS